MPINLYLAIFCNRGYYFAASTADNCVSLWATDRIKPLRIFADAGEDITELEFHPNCNYIIGGGEDKCIRIWDVLTGNCVRTLADPIIADRGEIRGIRVYIFSWNWTYITFHSLTMKTSPCGRFLVTAYAEGTVGIWDLAQQRLLLTQDCDSPFEYGTPIQFSRDASIVAIGTPHYGLSFFSMDLASTATHSGQQQSQPMYQWEGEIMFLNNLLNFLE
jgi:WD40 repeat protein